MIQKKRERREKKEKRRRMLMLILLKHNQEIPSPIPNHYKNPIQIGLKPSCSLPLHQIVNLHRTSEKLSPDWRSLQAIGLKW